MAGPGSGTGFQTFVNLQLPPGIAGDFAGANIRANAVAGAGQFYASPAGVPVGGAVWLNPATGVASVYYQPNSIPAFVHRDQQALLPNINSIAGMSIPGGDMVTGMVQGDFWGLFTAGGTPLQYVYANPVTGVLSAAASGSAVTATGTAGTVTSNVLTITPGTGTIAIGQIVTGGTLPPGTYIASGTGPWTLANVDGTAIPNNATSQAYTFQGLAALPTYQLASTVTVDAVTTAAIAVPATGVAYSLMTVSAVASGVLAAGQWLSGTGLLGSQNVQIISQASGTAGSTGTYYVTPVQTAIASTTITATQGKLGKISSWLDY